jgi:hypothetical protein
LVGITVIEALMQAAKDPPDPDDDTDDEETEKEHTLENDPGLHIVAGREWGPPSGYELQDAPSDDEK